MTTYTTPHFTTGLAGRAPRRARSASDDETLRTAQVLNPAAIQGADLSGSSALGMADVRTDDWQPGSGRGVPKAAVGALGAALVGGVALAIVLMAPSRVVQKPSSPDSVAAQSHEPGRPADGVDEMNRSAPAAGPTAPTPTEAATATTLRAQEAAAAAQATAAQSAGTAPTAQAGPVAAPSPVVVAPARRSAPAAQGTSPAVPTPAMRTAPRLDTPAEVPDVAPADSSSSTLPSQSVTPDAAAPAPVTPPLQQQTPGLQPAPGSGTVTPALPTPVPTVPTPSTTP